MFTIIVHFFMQDTKRWVTDDPWGDLASLNALTISNVEMERMA